MGCKQSRSLAELTISPQALEVQRLEKEKGTFWWLDSEVDGNAPREQPGSGSAEDMQRRAKEQERRRAKAWSAWDIPTSKLAELGKVAMPGEPVTAKALSDILAMSADTLNGISLQARLTGEMKGRQSALALLQTVLCIMKQCIEEPRYTIPLGVGPDVNQGHETAELLSAEVLRLAARYAVIADAAYEVSSSASSADKVLKFVADGTGADAGLTVLETFAAKRLAAKGSKRIMSAKTTPMFLATDHKNNDAMVFAIRGTHSVADALTDGIATPVRVQGAQLFEGYAHVGIVNATHAALSLTSDQIQAFLTQQVQAHEEGKQTKQLVITGHSLGGAVAVVVLMMLMVRHKLVRKAVKYGLIKVFTFGAPPSLAFRHHKQWTGKEIFFGALLRRGQPIWSFVNQFDPVPRFGVRSAQLLFTAANRVRLTKLQKFRYLRLGAKIDERLPDWAEPLALGCHAPDPEPEQESAEQKMKRAFHVVLAVANTEAGEAAAAPAAAPAAAQATPAVEREPAAAVKGESAGGTGSHGDCFALMRRRRSGPELLRVWRKRGQLLLKWMRRFKRLTTPLRHLGNVFQIYYDEAGKLHCEQIQSHMLDRLLFHEKFGGNHSMDQYKPLLAQLAAQAANTQAV